MDPKNTVGMWLAPSASGGAARAYAPGADEELPAVDDNLVEADGGYELVDGVRIELAPASEAHGEQHFELPGVLKMCLAPGYKGAVDMLTRTDKKTNIAPDVSIYPAERDPVTGGRKLEELVFEVLDSQSLSDVQWRAQRLIDRGVRRAFAIHASKKQLFEWMPEAQEWRVWLPQEFLTDRCFAVPVAVGALLDDTLADDTVARALLTRNSAVLQAALQDARDEARAEEMGTSILELCEVLAIEVTDSQRTELASLSLPQLQALRSAIKKTRVWPSKIASG